MEEYNIAIIKPNNYKIQDLILKKNIDRDFLNNIIKENIEFKKVYQTNMMEYIINTINLTPEIMGSTSMCYQDNKNIYQLCHLDLKTSCIDTEQKINSIGSCLALDDEVKDYAVLIKSKICQNNLCEPDSINNYEEIVDVLCHSLIHTGLKIDVDGNVSEYQFFEDPCENIPVEELHNWRCVDVPILKFDLLMFIQLKPTNDIINKKATRLAGKCVINGDVLLVSKYKNNIYLDLNKDMYNKIDTILWGTLKSRDLTPDELKDGESSNRLPIVLNRYCVLDARYNLSIKKKSKNSICTGCYRIKYDNLVDQKNDWTRHKKECLYNKRPYNIYLQIKEEKDNDVNNNIDKKNDQDNNVGKNNVNNNETEKIDV